MRKLANRSRGQPIAFKIGGDMHTKILKKNVSRKIGGFNEIRIKPKVNQMCSIISR